LVTFRQRARIRVGLLLALAVGALAGVAQARLLVSGKGKQRELVRAQFSAEQQPRYDLFAKKCTRCHDMARPIEALETGVAPVTGAGFDERSIRRYVIKMMRKSKSGIRKRDAKELVEFLVYARRLAQDPSPPADLAPDAGPPADARPEASP
jgi:hypothetical protein